MSNPDECCRDELARTGSIAISKRKVVLGGATVATDQHSSIVVGGYFKFVCLQSAALPHFPDLSPIPNLFQKKSVVRLKTRQIQFSLFGFGFDPAQNCNSAACEPTFIDVTDSTKIQQDIPEIIDHYGV